MSCPSLTAILPTSSLNYSFPLKNILGKSVQSKYTELQLLCVYVCVCVPLKKEKHTSKAIFLKENYFFNKNNALGKKISRTSHSQFSQYIKMENQAQVLFKNPQS